MLKVLSIASYQFLPPKTGGQKGIALFNRSFAKHVSLSCASVPENADNNTEAYEILPMLGSGTSRYINPILFFRIRRYIQQNNISHVLLEHPYYGWLGYLLKKFTGIQLTIHAHNIEALRFRDIGKWWWRILWHYEKNTFRTADTCFFISEEDRQYAIQHYGVSPGRSIVVTYGINKNTAPSAEEKRSAKQKVATLHHFSEETLLLLFSAAFNYQPNLNALDDIINNIVPALEKENIPYRVIISGSQLPERYDNLKRYAKNNIIFAGFVDDINLYFTAADIFLNPISDGGGIKTKLVEALSVNTSSISYASGAYGIPLSTTGDKLLIVPDNDSIAFSKAIIQSIPLLGEKIPSSFFDHFFWDNITRKAAEKMQDARSK